MPTRYCMQCKLLKDVQREFKGMIKETQDVQIKMFTIYSDWPLRDLNIHRKFDNSSLEEQ